VIYQFGPFHLDASTRRLWRGDVLVPLTPKAVETLMVLVASSGDLVEKDDLLKAVWPDTFVEEATLAQNISTLRKALGDASETPIYIATVPRRGYRFISPVTVVDSEPSKSRRRFGTDVRVRDWMATAVVLALVGAVVAFRLAHSASQESVPVVFTIQPPDGGTFSTSGGFMAVSPNGRHVAFVATDRDGKELLWIRSLASPAARPLAGTEGAVQPFWSPDSRRIAFFAAAKMRSVDVDTGQLHTICSIPFGSQPLAGTWNTSDDILFWSLRDGMLRVKATGGSPTRAIGTDAEDEHVGWPQFLPDQRRFLYVVTSSKQPNRTGVYVASLDSPERSRVLTTRSFAQYAAPGYLLFVRDGTLIAQSFDAAITKLTGDPVPIAERVAFNGGSGRGIFSVSQNGLVAYRTVGDTTLQWFDRAGKAMGTVGAPGAYLQFSIASDNTRVAASRIDPVKGTSDIWVLDASGSERRLTFDPAWDTLPLWSPDETDIIFSSNRSGRWEVYHKASSGVGTDDRFVRSETSAYADDWLPDGRVLVRQTDSTGRPRFLLVPRNNDRVPAVLPRAEVVQTTGSVSKDGRWLAVEGRDTAPSIYVRPVDSADERWEIGTGGMEPRWRADGRELFYLSPDRSIMSVAVEGGATFRPSVAHRLFQTHAITPSGVAGQAYAASQDGQRFLVNVPASSPPITVVVNWIDLLRQRR
jgi:DNA-binding winged helix-turn-helix (wHTH) protein/Tol biopolymer transport system component